MWPENYSAPFRKRSVPADGPKGIISFSSVKRIAKQIVCEIVAWSLWRNHNIPFVVLSSPSIQLQSHHFGLLMRPHHTPSRSHGAPPRHPTTIAPHPHRSMACFQLLSILICPPHGPTPQGQHTRPPAVVCIGRNRNHFVCADSDT